MWYTKQENGLYSVGIADVVLARDLVEQFARMFAAAPDMLRALHDALPHVENASALRAVIARAEKGITYENQ